MASIYYSCLIINLAQFISKIKALLSKLMVITKNNTKACQKLSKNEVWCMDTVMETDVMESVAAGNKEG